MKPSEDRIREFQEIWKKQYGKDISVEEAEDYIERITGLLKVLIDCSEEEHRREERLKKEPKGFLLDGVGYTCFICGKHTERDEAWYDKYGIKCLTCQKGINKKQIPASMAKNKDAWYSTYDLSSRFNVKSPTLRKWIREGVIKARSITNDQGRPYVQIFLIKDNKHFLPPKKLTDLQTVSEVRDGKTWHRCEPWYHFVNPFEHLKGYAIMDYMKFSEPKKTSNK